MKNTFWFLASLIIMALSITACDSDNGDIINPIDEVSFQVERSNSDNNYISNTQEVTLKGKSSYWSTNTSGEMGVIYKEASYDITLENGEIVVFGLWFAKHQEDANLLVLEDENETGFTGENWDYLSSEIEAENFYKNCSDIRITIDNNVIFTESNSDNDIVEVETAMVDGIEKSYITVDFTGSAFGWYDPDGTFQEVYTFTNGMFKGVIE